MPTSSTLNVAIRFGEYAQKRQNTAALQNIAVPAHTFLALRFGVGWCSTAFRCSKSTLNFHLSPHNNNGVPSRGWHSAPRDLPPAQALARYSRRVQRFRRDAHLCDLIAARGPSFTVAKRFADLSCSVINANYPRLPNIKNKTLHFQTLRNDRWAPMSRSQSAANSPSQTILGSPAPAASGSNFDLLNDRSPGPLLWPP